MANNTERKFDPIDKSMKNPKSLRLAINAKCWECIGEGCDPAPQRAIANCQCSNCPLYIVRPYRKLKNKEAFPTG